MACGCSLVYTLQIRNPLIPSSILTFIKISIFSLFVTNLTSCFALAQLTQGIKNEYPALSLRQLML